MERYRHDLYCLSISFTAGAGPFVGRADTFKSYGKPLEDETLAICYLNRRAECFQEL
jgi:hypothetical protein